ncbi:rod shape-determining protein MreC [Bacteriovoracaceae bacterium]|nr:rod shape-determining protein MreC [Bacteriovoracaceae bacterium]
MIKNVLRDYSRPKLINSIVVIILSFFGLATQNYQYSDSSLFEKVCLELFSPLQSGMTQVQSDVRNFFDNYFNIVDTRKENKKLTKKLDRYRNKIFQLQQIEKENKRLKKLLQFGAEVELKKVMAQVIGWDSSNEFKLLRVNRGLAQGIEPQSPVITMDGLVGYVYKVSENYADILTILDANNRVDALIDNTRVHGILEGSFDFYLTLKYVRRSESIKQGDLVITAGLGDIYPKGIKVGVVDSIEKESYSLTQKIEVKPTVNFHKLEEVVILTKNDEVVKE